MNSINLKEALNKIKKAKIGIIGDFCLDVYWHINNSKSEISVETNLKTKPVEFQIYSPGGAGNVANNLSAMEVGDISVFGVVGPDPFGSHMKGLLNLKNIKTEGLIVQNQDWSTHVYVKPVAEGIEQNRIDFGNFNYLSGDTVHKLISCLKSKAKELDIVIINQQVITGIHNNSFFRKELQKVVDEFTDTLFILDSRHFGGAYKNVLHKINSYEAVTLCGLKYNPDDFVPLNEAQNALTELYNKWQKPVFVTRGDRGCLVIDENSIDKIPGLHITGKLDTVGAGDSMLSGIASCLAVGYTPSEAATFGNFVSGVTVQKLFITGTANPEEILAVGENADYVYNVDKADDIRTAEYYNNSEIEIVSEIPSNLKITHAIFDHDGTISTLREGWESIMKPMMVKAILGNSFDSACETDYFRVNNRVDKFIDETTGIQTLKQMQGLIELVREFGFVPENEILDEFGYKAIYNDELLKLVGQRLAKFKSGELELEDFSVKSAIDFLEYLSNKGIKLYLASGTDEQDVILEAEALGYANLFEGRIFGSVGDINKDAKKIVMNRIFESIGGENRKNVVAFGDGPVEVREIKKRGGIGIGIASDEIRRFGLSFSKRSRLIKAGADIIIPDYTQRNNLYKLLNI